MSNKKNKFFKKKSKCGSENVKKLDDDAIAKYLQTRHEVDEFLKNYDVGC